MTSNLYRISTTVAIIALVLSASSLLRADEVSLSDAKTAVRGWLAQRAAKGVGRGAVSGGRTVKSDGEPFHVITVSIGGFVVTAADTDAEPITAFSPCADLDENPHNPLYALLLAHARARNAARAAETNSANSTAVPNHRRTASGTTSKRHKRKASEKWSALFAAATNAAGTTAASPRTRSAAAAQPETNLSEIDDVRVAPIILSTWDQKTAGNYSNGPKCYNYYTPNNWPCGCVATAGAQIMRYFEFPSSNTVFASCINTNCAVNGVETSLETRGGSFDWANMPLSPTFYATETQCRAIGHLCYDVGVLCEMWYGPYDSLAFTDTLARMLRHYGYANAVAAYAEYPVDDSDLLRATVSNLDAGLPVALGIFADGGGGHTVVGDGYGYCDDAFYLHINMGWSGNQTAWYNPPNFANDNYAFDTLDSVVYNIYTTGTAGDVICSGRVLAPDGETPVANATVCAIPTGATTPLKATRSRANGIYALILPPGTYTIAAVHGLMQAANTVSLSACVSSETDKYGMLNAAPVIGNLCDQDIALTPGPGFFLTIH